MYRRMLKRIGLCLVILLVLSAVVGRVTIAASNNGQTAANFLAIGMGAGASAMGDANTAAARGSVAAYWNPAGLAGLEKTEVMLSHFSWLQDTKLEHGVVAFPLGEKVTLATSITYLGYGQIRGYDRTGEYTSDLNSYDLAGGVSLGFQASGNLSIGLTAKYVSQKMADVSGSTFAGDLGVKYSIGWITLGGVIANVGPELQFQKTKEKLPTSARVGLALSPFGSQFVATFELDKRRYGRLALHQGAEYSFNDLYFLRAGYTYLSDQEIRSFGSGVSLGGGVRLGSVTLDYAFTPKDNYTSDNLHRFSVSYVIGR